VEVEKLRSTQGKTYAFTWDGIVTSFRDTGKSWEWRTFNLPKKDI